MNIYKSQIKSKDIIYNTYTYFQGFIGAPLEIFYQ